MGLMDQIKFVKFYLVLEEQNVGGQAASQYGTDPSAVVFFHGGQPSQNIMDPNKDSSRRYSKPKCPHGRAKAFCFECGGSQICCHNRKKNLCRECGGKDICPHDKVMRYCVDCKGSAICEHLKRRDRCLACGGKDFCVHGKRKSRCKDCGGSEICEHGKVKSLCRQCGFCMHDKRKSRCAECGTGAIQLLLFCMMYCKTLRLFLSRRI